MRILLSVHHHLSGDAGALGVTVRLAQEYRQLGHRVAVVSFDMLPWPVRGRAAQVVYPWFVTATVTARFRSFDVIDASSGDAWLLGALPSGTRPVLVARSHGLEHNAHLQRLDAAQRGDLTLSWR